MADNLFQVIVTGKLASGATAATAKQNVARLFKAPVEKIEPLFSGQRAAIKKGLDEETARKYQLAVMQAGLECVIEEEIPAPAAAPPVPPAPASPSSAMQGVTLAPAGTLLIDPARVAPAHIDTSAYTLAPAGGLLVEQPVVPPLEIDTSELRLDPAGVLLVAPRTVPPAGIDTRDLNLAPAGSDMGEAKRPAGAPPPDTSHLHIE